MRKVIVLVFLSLLFSTCSKMQMAGSADYKAEQSKSAAPAESDGAPGTELDLPTAPAGRVLIKTGTLSLVVMDAVRAMEKIEGLLKQYGAFEAGRESYASVPEREIVSPSEVTSIRLTLKVPADRFEAFIRDLKETGSYVQEQTTVQDVTLQYVDLEARLASHKKVEERLLVHLQAASKIKDIVEVEKELARVREHVESLTAQFKVLQDQVAFSTLTVDISVRPDWIPPSERSLWEDVAETFGGSLMALSNTARLLLVYGLALLPWAVVFGGLGYGFRLLLRRRRRRKAKGVKPGGE